MRRACDISDYVKRNRYGNFLRREVLEEHFHKISQELYEDESVYSAFVGTVYSIQKHFIALTNKRLIIYSLEKGKQTSGVVGYPLDEIEEISLNDMKKGIIRIYMENELREVRAEPCYSKRITLELIERLEKLKQSSPSQPMKR